MGAVETMPDIHPPNTTRVYAIVAARNEEDRIGATLAALAQAFPGAPVWVADDGSSDATVAIAEAAGASVVRSKRNVWRGNRGIGKGGAVTHAAQAALGSIERTSGRDGKVAGHESVVLLCDGDLGACAARLGPLVEAVRGGEADLVVAAFSKRVGGGLGLAVGFAGWAIHRRAGLRLRAPISGQRAVRAGTLARVLPFAHGFGMEIGMTIDAARAGARVRELDLDLAHRATGRTLGGFAHRGRQLLDFVRVYVARR
jgi:glycosyltransferase involved in cell wall biosynthesis